MTFGDLHGDKRGIQSVDDTATVEKMRLKQVADQRKREGQAKAKRDSQAKKVKLRIIQEELARRNNDIKKIDSDLFRISSDHKYTENYEANIKDLRNKINEFEREIMKQNSLKSAADKDKRDKEREIKIIQDKRKFEEREISRLDTECRKSEEEIRVLEKQANS